MDSGAITIATLLWQLDPAVYDNTYDESWVEKLCAGFKRNLTRPMRFVAFCDEPRTFSPGIEVQLIERRPITYGVCIEPYKLNVPTIIVGLDTIVTGNCDELADYCFYGDRVAVPVDPFYPSKVCNGVALVPAGQRTEWWDNYSGQNDMDWTRQKHEAGAVALIDDLFSGQVQSYKGSVQQRGVGAARIVYFHGDPKPSDLGHIGWIDRHWGVA